MAGSTNRPQGACLVYNIKEFNTIRLPEGVQAKWQKFQLDTATARAQALREATFRIYSVIEGHQSPQRQRRQAQLANMRARAAEAAAALATEQTEAECTSALAARLLAHMEAAKQRRQEVQEARRARLTAKKDLLLQRLASSETPEVSDSQQRREFLMQLQARVAAADARDQQQGTATVEAVCGHECKLKELVAKHGMEDWMQGLSPKSAASAAAFRINRSSRRLQRSWRRFASQHKSTTQLAQAFAAQSIANLDNGQQPPESAASAADQQAAETEAAAPSAPGLVMIGSMAGGRPSPKHACFEEFAAKLQSPVTIKAAQALLHRLEKRLSVRGVTNDAAQSLLRQLSPSTPAGRQLERFPVRVMLCAYMIKEHPEVVFNKVGNVEARLSAAAHQMLFAFEALLARLLQPSPSNAAAPATAGQGPVCPSPLANSMTSYLTAPKAGAFNGRSSRSNSGAPVARQLFPTDSSGSFNSSASSSSSTNSQAATVAPAGSTSQQAGSLAGLLVAFDDSWLEYLDQFVVWKGHDAASLEQELMRMAVRLERSMRLKLGRRELDSPEVRANPDLQAMIAQVSHDHALLAERIARLTGPDGSARLKAALEHVRQQVASELQAAEDAESEASWETSSDAARSRPVSRSASRAGSFVDPLSDAEALAAAQAAAQSQQGPEAAPPSPTAEGASDAAAQQSDALSNEQMVWEMLYNPNYSLPAADAEAAWHRAMGKEAHKDEVDASDAESMSPEQLTALVSKRARLIAERAFWDSIVWRFKTAAQGQALSSQLAPLLSELGTELSGFVSDNLEAEQLRQMYAESAVLARLSSSTGQQGGGANLTALGAMMEQLAQTLLKSGSQERAAEGADAARELHARMAAALAAAAGAATAAEPSSSSDSSSGLSSPQQAARREEAATAAALAEALSAALRLLMTQLKLIKLDAANARLAGLARAMRERGAVSYLQTKLTAAWELPELADISSGAERQRAAATVAERLPRTAAWVDQVQHGLQQELQAGLSSAGLLLDPAAATAAVVAGGLQSVELRSGVRASPTASPGRSPQQPRSPASTAASPSAASGAIKPRFPVTLDSWQGLVRAGLLALVSSNTPAAGPQLPEVLGFDRVRLHDLQNSLQQLMVTAAGLLIVQQLRQAAGLAWDAPLRAQARRRLLVVLSDPGMKLSHLVTELGQLAGATSLASEERVRHMFTTIVNPEASAFKSIRSGIITALTAHLLYGRAAMAADGSAGSACANVLSRVGAAALMEDVAELGQKVAGVAAVCEAVNGAVISLLAAAHPQS